MAEALYDAWRWVVPVLLVLLVLLARIRNRTFREVAEVTDRDEGLYWQSLPWEERNRYRRRITVVSWVFVSVFIATLVYAVWLQWYDIKFRP